MRGSQQTNPRITVSYPIKIPLDEDLSAKLTALAKLQNLALGTLVNGWLIRVNREIGIERLLKLESDYPLFLNPPQNSNHKLTIRVKDPDVVDRIAALSASEKRSSLIIYYSILKVISSKEYNKITVKWSPSSRRA